MTSSHQRKIYGRFNVPCASFTTAEGAQTTLANIWLCIDGGAGAELSVWHVVPLAGRLEFNKATSGRSGPERSAGVDSGEVKAWSSRGRFWLWEWGHGRGPTAPCPPPPARLPYICVLSNPEAGSCYRSLEPLMDGSISFWPHPHGTTSSPRCTQLTPLYSRHNLARWVTARVRRSITAIKLGRNY